MRAQTNIRQNPVALALLGHASRNSMATMGVQAAAALGVTLAARPAEAGFYWGWLTLTLSVLVIRLLIDRLLVSALRGRFLSDRLDIVAGAFSAGLLISAALWAILACLRFPIDSERTRYVTIVILSALAGGATGVLAPLKLTGRLYISLILLPASLTMILATPSETILGVLGASFWLVMLAGHRNNHALLVDSIKLRDENHDLLQALTRRSHDLNTLNRELEDRVVLRTRQLENATLEAQAASKAKSRFLAMVSHEMRTPLNAVIGIGQLVTRSGLPEAQREQVFEMKAAARRLRQMIDDVLDLSRLDDGDLSIKSEPFSLAALAQSLDDLHRPTAHELGLRLTMSLDSGGYDLRCGDIDRLRQVTRVLITNALKFTRKGGVDCHIVGGPERLEIDVSDSGDGIPQDKLAAIFDRFSQADDSSHREAGGIGIGLALCHDLVKRMGGDIRVTSTSNTGSTFRLWVPCLPAEPASPEALCPEAALEPTGDEQALRLLVVDDNAMNRRILAALVEPFGMACSFASDGREAVEAWRRQPWGAILMDIHMPVMDGIEAARAIREEESFTGRPRTPIIAVTASLREDETESYLEAGMDDVLPKPIETPALADVLTRCIAPN